MKNFIKEFKEFAIKGNVVDLAVGVVIGGAFGKIVTSLVNDLIMPFALMLTGSSLAGRIELRPATETTEGIYLNWGAFLQTIIDFTIIALCIFVVIRLINKLKREKPTEPVVEEVVVTKSDETVLLENILEELRKR